MASTTLQEFLVQLGFKIDETQLGKFTSSLVSVSKQVVGISLALEGAYVALTAFTTKIASELENLFYSSQRAGTTIQNLQALQFALGQTGQGADSAAGMLQQFAMSMRMNPAIEGFLNGLGVMTRGVDGHLRDTNTIFEDFITKMRSEPFPIAAQMAEYLGISPQQLLMLETQQDARLKAEREFVTKEGQLGLDPDKFGRTSVDYMNSLRDLGSTVEIIFQKIGVNLLPSMTEAIEHLNKFLLDHHKEIENFADQVDKAIVGVLHDAGDLATDLDSLVKNTIGWKSALELVADLLAIRIFGPMAAFLIAYEKLKGFQAEHEEENAQNKDLGQMPQGLRNRLGQLGDLSEAVANGMKKALEWFKTQGGISPMGYNTFSPEQAQAIHAALYGGATAYGHATRVSYNAGNTVAVSEPSGAGTIAMRHNNPGNLRAAPTAVGVSRGFAVFSSALEGFVAMGGLLQRYASRGIDTVASIISKWAPPSENNTGAYIAQIARALGVDPNTHLNLRDPGVLSQIMAAIAHVESGKDPWSKDLMDQAARSVLGGAPQSGGRSNVHIEQHNHIRSTDPAAAGQEVAVKTRTIWSDIIRVMRQPGVYA